MAKKKLEKRTVSLSNNHSSTRVEDFLARLDAVVEKNKAKKYELLIQNKQVVLDLIDWCRGKEHWVTAAILQELLFSGEQLSNDNLCGEDK